MDETDADRRAEMPEDSRKVAGGTGETHDLVVRTKDKNS